MEKDGFKFEAVRPRGTEFYYGKDTVGTVLKAVEKVIADDNATQQETTRKAIALADSQNEELRAGLGVKKDYSPGQQSGKEVMSFLQEAEKLNLQLDLTQSEAYQEYPLLTVPGSCVYRYPSYDFPWTDVGGGGIGGVSTRPGAVNGNLGGSCLFSIGGSAHVHAGAGFWFYSGAHRGPMDIYAEFSTYGRCALSAFLSYASTQVRLNAGIYGWSEGNWMDINRTDIYNNWIAIGFTYSDFNYQHNVITARAWVQPYRWYAVWGWTQIWATIGGAASGGSNIWSYLRNVRVCVGN